MEGRELGCKLTGCLFGVLLIFGFFGMLMNFTDSTARSAMAKRQRMDADMDLPLLFAGAREYAKDHDGALPPLGSAAEMKAALFPRYVAIEEAFVRFGDNVRWEPNAALSGKKMVDVKPDAPFAFEPRTGLPGKKKEGPEGPSHAVLFLDGSVRRVPEADWAAFRTANRLP